MAGFESILENEEVKEYFRRALESGRISHCYIIGGEDGLGKMTLAKAAAQTLICEAPGEKPCGSCPACTRFLAGSHPDVLYPKHAKPTVFGVDDVRDGIVRDMLIKPYSSPYKIYIVDEAEKLSVQAQNALLKTIEEPPAYGILMLLATNPAAFLETIRSRSVILTMKPVSNPVLERYLKEQGIDEQKIPSLVRFSQGNIGKALKLAQSERFSEMTGRIMELLKRSDSMSFGSLLEGIGELEEYKLEIMDILSFIRMWYRDILLFKATSDPNLLIFGDEFSSIRKFSQKYSYNGIEHILKEIDVTERRLDANVNYSLSLELLWIAIREAAGVH